MICFENGELEVVVVTYNRKDFVEEWLIKNHDELTKRNIRIRIVDSSTNDDTEKYISWFNKEYNANVDYEHLNANVLLGYKPVKALLTATTEYTWITADSRYFDYDDMDNKVFPKIKDKIDYIVMQIVNNENNDDKIYIDKSQFIHECFISTTCLGNSIYRNEIFKEIKNNTAERAICDQLFKENYAFAWLGYFYTEFAKKAYRVAFEKVKIINIYPEKKTPSWIRKFYGCWLVDLCEIVDNIPEIYNGKESIPAEVWKDMNLYGDAYSYMARKYGDLNSKSFNYFLDKGLISRITTNCKKIKFYALAPMPVVEIRYFIFRCTDKIDRIMRRGR